MADKQEKWQDQLVLVRELVVRDTCKYSAMGVDPTLAVVEFKPAFCTNFYLMTRGDFEDRFGRESPIVGYEIVWVE